MKVENKSERKERMEKFLGEISKRKVEVKEVQIIGREEYKMTRVRFNKWEDKREVEWKRGGR